jgi:hypothetical protein
MAPPERQEEAVPESGAGAQLHVRNVGVEGWDGTPEGRGTYEEEEQLGHVFRQFGEFVQATVRHRIDGAGRNTSWALVTMADAASAERALEVERVMAGGTQLHLTRFDPATARTSTGMMADIRRRDRATASRRLLARLAAKSAERGGHGKLDGTSPRGGGDATSPIQRAKYRRSRQAAADRRSAEAVAAVAASGGVGPRGPAVTSAAAGAGGAGGGDGHDVSELLPEGLELEDKSGATSTAEQRERRRLARRKLRAAAGTITAANVSRSRACIGSPCLKHCVHGASIGAGGGRRRQRRRRQQQRLPAWGSCC